MIPMATIEALARQFSVIADGGTDREFYDSLYELLFNLEQKIRVLDTLPARTQKTERRRAIAALRKKYPSDDPFGDLLKVMEAVVNRDLEVVEAYVPYRQEE